MSVISFDELISILQKLELESHDKMPNGKVYVELCAYLTIEEWDKFKVLFDGTETK